VTELPANMENMKRLILEKGKEENQADTGGE
jgi:hypothetical protein